MQLRGSTKRLDIAELCDRVLEDSTSLESFYTSLHREPELSGQERQTAGCFTTLLKHLGYDVKEGIGGHGVVGVLFNGEGNTVLLRAELDALPVVEETGLPYASTRRMRDDQGVERPVMHACGHDVNMTCLLGAAQVLMKSRSKWSGTLVILLQPAEETGAGAKSMIDDGLYEVTPRPDVLLAQHVSPAKAGTVSIKTGPVLTAAATLQIVIYGRGGHGSAPHTCIDPIVIAAFLIVRLQTVVSREAAPGKIAVVTCGSIQAGNAANVIPDEASLAINVRATSSEQLDNMLERIKTIVQSECQQSEVPKEPSIKVINRFPATINDEIPTTRVRNALKDHFAGRLLEMEQSTASEDFSRLAHPIAAPYVYWSFGGTDAQKWDSANKEGRLNLLPGNHSSKFAPAIQPTIRTGVEALTAAALVFLA